MEAEVSHWLKSPSKKTVELGVQLRQRGSAVRLSITGPHASLQFSTCFNRAMGIVEGCTKPGQGAVLEHEGPEKKEPAGQAGTLTSGLQLPEL